MDLNSYDFIIPIGSNCRIGMALRDIGLRKIAFPLDWTLTTSRSIYECFLNDFEDFLSPNSCKEQNLKHIVNFKHITNYKYNVNITHEPLLSKEAIDKYKRKTLNLNNVLSKSNKILLIRNMLDCKILDVLHNDIAAKEEKEGFKHYDLTWIYKTKDLLTNKYPNLEVDLLVIYYNVENIRNNIRDDVYYRTSNYPKIGKEWDRFACAEILKESMRK
tara:strand:+ start:8053 stop:8703 length:651 start_codon:yes stop_codon:yes gene_type:complete